MLSTAKLTRRQIGRTLAAALVLPPFARSQTGFYRVQQCRRSFSVFSLFQPQCLTLEADAPLMLHLDRTDAATELHRIPAAAIVRIRFVSGDRLEVELDRRTLTHGTIRLTSTSGEDAAFTLGVPPSSLHGGLRREFCGTLKVRPALKQLEAVLTMDTEAATASIVHAESPPKAAKAYFEAQAIVVRSFLYAADTGHQGFDFCDTTHCQFLRERPPEGSDALLATRATARLHLAFQERPFAAMYSRSCGGRTHTLAELGLPTISYPYYAVECSFCKEYPEQWRREADGAPMGERERLAFNRIYGWSALPSSSFVEEGAIRRGSGIGHGVGLCQLGAAALAARGHSTDSVLAHFYPNTTVRLLDG